MRPSIVCPECGRPITSTGDDTPPVCPFCIVDQALREGDSRPGATAGKTESVRIPAEVTKAAPSARMGKYVRVAKLGSGGMGEVWKAWDSELERWVALKHLRHEDPRELERFTREARTAAALSHPNIAAVYEAGEVGGRHYIAMQLVDGRTMDQRPRTDRRGLVTLMRDAARAIGFAHKHGIVHRDLKPTNLMVSEGESGAHIVVLDFGLARRVEGGAKLSGTGTLAGTPDHISPEQTRGRPADARSDVYSLGVTLYELLTGRTPFESDDLYDLLRKITDSEPKAPRALDRSIDRDLETIVLKCIEKDPQRRYVTAEALARDLDRWLAGEPVLARAAGIIRRIQRRVFKRKTVISAVAAIAVLIGVLGWWVFKGSPEREHLRHFNEGMEAFDEFKQRAYGDVDRENLKKLAARARSSFQKAIDAVETVKGRWMLGRCFLLEDRRQEAVKAFERALSLDPSSPAVRLELAKSLLIDYQFRRGRPHIYRLEGEPDRLGHLQAESDGMARLRLRAEELLSNGPMPPDRTDLLKGLLSLGRGEFEVAAEHLGRHARQDPLDSLAIQLWCESLFYAGRHEDALKAIQRALILVRNKAGLTISGIIKSHCKDPEGALKDLEQAVLLDPSDPGVFFVKGNVRATLRDFSGALREFQEAVRLNPKYAWAWHNSGMSRIELRDFAGAVADLQRATALRPRDAESLSVLAKARMGLEDYEGAIVDCTTAIGIDPNNALAYFNRGAARYNLGRKRKDIELVKHANTDMIMAVDRCQDKSIQKSMAQTVHRVCDRLQEAGQWEAAIAGNRKVVETLGKEPPGTFAAYNIACGLSILGEKESALTWLEKTVELGWKDVEHLEKDSDLESLRSESRYKALVDGLKKN